MKKKEIEKERDLLIAQLHDVQERLEELYIESGEKYKRIAESEAANASLKEKLDSAVSELNEVRPVYNEIVDYLTRELGASASVCDAQDGPLSAIKLLMEQKARAEKDATTVASMNERLLTQLHGVQEQFESCFLKSQEQAKTIEDQEEKIRSKNKKLQKLSQRKREAVERAQALEVEIEELRAVTEVKPDSQGERSRSFNILGKALLKRSQKVDLYSKELSLIKSCSLFDEVWYLEKNKDVAESGIDPALHYFLYGAEDRRDPSPHFSTEWYLNTYPDVAQEKINPLLHYLIAGKSEGRKLSSM
ncbi:hypothetical protein [Microbulbifer hydrolyticus]|uniref:Chromosome segregation ATPase n=1 Tax=Microbulbifer hydrolyticus TaxID=48074 RepID=A0A6P1TB12_9GAMM|nr:hypothetical protein [Microbulbifer hydrolyticus]MBB5212311.1 chromosome segregation ATPase [Microbulbifer hydrolyticus]QHQ39958.1 hypothetical protein GTQ55_13835 [Microbulbifer hydrolyticus]